MSDQDGTRPTDQIVRNAQIATFFWLVVFVLALVVWRGGLRDIKINELGDVLAGFFAPLAFIWLSLSVYIQNKELKNQVNELKLSRQAFEDQVKENRRAVEQFSEQTRLAKIQTDQIILENSNVVNERKITKWLNRYYNVSKKIDYAYSNITKLNGSFVCLLYRTAFDLLPASEDVKEALGTRNTSVAIRELEIEIKETLLLIEASVEAEISIFPINVLSDRLEELRSEILSLTDSLISEESPLLKTTQIREVAELFDRLVCFILNKKSAYTVTHDSPHIKISNVDFSFDSKSRLYVRLFVNNSVIYMDKRANSELFRLAQGIERNVPFAISNDDGVLFLDEGNIAFFPNDIERFFGEEIKENSQANASYMKINRPSKQHER